MKTNLLQTEDETMQVDYWKEKFFTAETALVGLQDDHSNLV